MQKLSLLAGFVNIVTGVHRHSVLPWDRVLLKAVLRSGGKAESNKLAAAGIPVERLCSLWISSWTSIP